MQDITPKEREGIGGDRCKYVRTYHAERISNIVDRINRGVTVQTTPIDRISKICRWRVNGECKKNSDHTREK